MDLKHLILQKREKQKLIKKKHFRYIFIILFFFHRN